MEVVAKQLHALPSLWLNKEKQALCFKWMSSEKVLSPYFTVSSWKADWTGIYHIFAEAHTYSTRGHKITHMHTVHLQADGYTSTHAFTGCCPLFELIDLLLKDSISECTTGKHIGGSSSQVPLFGQLVSVWGRQHKKRVFVMSWRHEPKLFVFDNCVHCVSKGFLIEVELLAKLIAWTC